MVGWACGVVKVWNRFAKHLEPCKDRTARRDFVDVVALTDRFSHWILMRNSVDMPCFSADECVFALTVAQAASSARGRAVDRDASRVARYRTMSHPSRRTSPDDPAPGYAPRRSGPGVSWTLPRIAGSTICDVPVWGLPRT